MTTATMLMREIETLPDESVAEVLENKISIEDAYGIFKGIDTHFEREEEDRESMLADF
jgi:hypothetical protein